MNWRFWKPRQTLASVARQLAEGLTRGTIALDEPLADDSVDERTGAETLVLQLDVPDNLADTEILELIKRLSLNADKEHRRHGGQGLAIRVVVIPRTALATKAVSVTLQSRGDADRPDVLAAVVADLQQRPDVHVLAVPAAGADLPGR